MYITPIIRRNLENAIATLSKQGNLNNSNTNGENVATRCLAVARKQFNNNHLLRSLNDSKLITSELYEKIESNLTLIGVCGLLDPPRKSSRGAIQKCIEAGLRVIMITGYFLTKYKTTCSK